MTYYKTKTIYEPIYDFNLRFVVSNDRQKIIKKHGIDFLDDYAQSSKAPTKNKKAYTIILCDDIKDKAMLADIISHEADHVRDFIMEDIGEDPHWVSESKAYLLGWIVRELTRFIIK